MIELDFLPEDTAGHDRGPRGKMDFATADLYDLTYEAFRGPITFAIDDADYSGTYPVLDVALGLIGVTKDLATKKRTRYCVAEGGGDFHFERKGDLVFARLSREPKGTVAYVEFCDAAKAFMKKALQELPRKFPDLSKNSEIQALTRSYLQRPPSRPVAQRGGPTAR
ncbi:hypothetical protein [Streptomyces sp. NPDC091268]|uniref:hypothetical protein n=1 Tax=Streptomyces sp. NPDC091268 TaxID=3365979 RepID=UPI00382492D5